MTARYVPKMKIKTIIEFTVNDDLDDMICAFTKKVGFVPCSTTDTEGLVDMNNVTYCYCQSSGEVKTFLTIHILDNKVHIEAWIAEVIESDRKFLHNINELLVLMGQQQIV